MLRRAQPLVLLLSVILLAGACSDDGTASGANDGTPPTARPPPTATDPSPVETAPPGTTATPATTPEREPLRILVTNDDGVDAPGIGALVQSLNALEDVEVTVVAADDESEWIGHEPHGRRVDRSRDDDSRRASRDRRRRIPG
ncbi:MAG: 5'/3'-nucleotidase SurE [Acidimicrobiales bacterium]